MPGQRSWHSDQPMDWMTWSSKPSKGRRLFPSPKRPKLPWVGLSLLFNLQPYGQSEIPE
jgi:hypothetical protein